MLRYTQKAAIALRRRAPRRWPLQCIFQQLTYADRIGSISRHSFSTCLRVDQQKDTSCSNRHGELEKLLLRADSPFLTKFYQLLPAPQQHALRRFGDVLSRQSSTGHHIYSLYQTLRSQNLHRYLTFRAMQRVLSCVSADRSVRGVRQGDLVSTVVLDLIGNYSELGFTPSIDDYACLVRALAQEAGREKDALKLLDDLVDTSDIAPFLSSARKRRGKHLPSADTIPSEAEIERIEKSLLDEQQRREMSTRDANGEKSIESDIIKAEQADIESLKDSSELDRVQLLVIEERQKRRRRQEIGKEQKPLPVSRTVYHMAMLGFAQIYHVRGVMEVLSRMLETSTQVPYRVARHLMPNRQTWEIVSEVLTRQRDRPYFVKTWIEFLSRGARPPTMLTRDLVRLLVRQACVEQAVWVMRISRCLPDRGGDMPKSPYSTDHIAWELKVQIMYVASALEAATSLDIMSLSREDAMRQGMAAAQLPLLAKPDPVVYAHLIGGATRLKNEKLSEHLFKEMIDEGVVPEDATYGYLAKLYAEKGQIQRVFLIARDLLVRRHALLLSQDQTHAAHKSAAARITYRENIRKQANGLKADVECIAPLLQYYMREGRESEALMLLRSWDHSYGDRVPAEKLARALLQVYSQPGDSATIDAMVQRLLSKLSSNQGTELPESEATTSSGDSAVADTQVAHGQNFPETLETYALMLKTHIRAKNLVGVVRVMNEMAAKGIEPQYSTLEQIMQTALREQALDLFDTIHAYVRETLQLPLSLPLYAQWMRTLVNHGDVVGVQSAFDELLEMGQFPTQKHYTLLVQAYAYNGWVDRAVSIIDNLRKPYSIVKPGLNLNIAIIEAHVAGGNLDQAQAELRYLLDNTLLPMNKIPARPFNYLIIGHLYHGDGRRAMQMYESMLRLGVKPDVYTFAILMHSYALSKDIDNCTRVFNEMIRVGTAPDLVIYTILICAFGVAKRVGSAELVFNQVAQEQEWAQAQRESQTGRTINDEDPLDIYAEQPGRPNWPELLDMAETDTDQRIEEMRSRSFYNLDPVIYVAMLKVYCRGHRPLRALATWDRLIQNFPVAQWNPRRGGILSKSLSYTAEFHYPAWTLLLRTASKSIGAQRALKKKQLLVRYFFEPMYPAPMKHVLDGRRRMKLYRPGVFDVDTGPKLVREYIANLASRAEIVYAVERELDLLINQTYPFFVKHRYTVPHAAFDLAKAFKDFDFWLPEGVDKAEIVEAAEAFDSPPDSSKAVEEVESQLEDKPESMGVYDSNTQETAQSIASILVRQWGQLETTGFKFNNIHMCEYLSCMLLGRKYSELSRILSLIEPADPPADAHTAYRYRNLELPWYMTNLLLRQIDVVRKLLMGERDRRIALDCLLDIGSEMGAELCMYSRRSLAEWRRTDDELQVMRERRQVHLEREVAWAAELNSLDGVAKKWMPLVVEETLRERLREASERIAFAHSGVQAAAGCRSIE